MDKLRTVGHVAIADGDPIITSHRRWKQWGYLRVMHLSMFPPEGGGRYYPRELDNFEKFGPNSLPMWHSFVSKIPWGAYFPWDFLAETSKVPLLCQSPLSNSQGQWLFGSLIPKVFRHTPPPPPSGKNIDSCKSAHCMLLKLDKNPFTVMFWDHKVLE